MQQQRTISQSDCAVWWKTDFIQWQPAMTSSMFGNEKLQCASQSQSCTKKSSWLLFSSCCLSDSLQLSESWQNHYIWEVCSANQLDELKTAIPEASIGQQKGPNSSAQHPTTHSTTNASKVERIWLWSVASFAVFTWSLTNWLPLLQTSRQLFAGKMLPQPTGGRKHFPRVHQIPKHRFLCYKKKQTYFSLIKMYW